MKRNPGDPPAARRPALERPTSSDSNAATAPPRVGRGSRGGPPHPNGLRLALDLNRRSPVVGRVVADVPGSGQISKFRPSRPARACSSTRSCCWGRRTVRPRAERLEARPPPGGSPWPQGKDRAARRRGAPPIISVMGGCGRSGGPTPSASSRTLQAEYEAWRDQLPGSPAHDAHAGIMENPT